MYAMPYLDLSPREIQTHKYELGELNMTRLSAALIS